MTDSTMVERLALIFAQHGDHFFDNDGPSNASWDDFSPRERLVATAAARAAIEAIANAMDEVPYDPHGAEVTLLHHWFAEHYSAAEWMDDGCRSENARDLLNTLSKAGFIIVPTSLFRLSKGEE